MQDFMYVADSLLSPFFMQHNKEQKVNFLQRIFLTNRNVRPFASIKTANIVKYHTAAAL